MLDQARSQVQIWGVGWGWVLFLAKVDLFTCFSKESGIFYTHFCKKWTFLCSFLEKEEFFACSPHTGSMFPEKIKKKEENYALGDIMT